MNVSDFDYDLPEELIAQGPAEPRDHSRLMIVDRKTEMITHDYFYNLPKYLDPESLVVFNNTKVIPARLYGKKETGGQIEILLLEYGDGLWKFIGKNIGRAKSLEFERGLRGEIVHSGVIKFNVNYAELMTLLSTIGHIPLPPYIAPERERDNPNKIRTDYQTVYAKVEGSVAAPTAGLHFTQPLLDHISHKTFVTLQVGLGTFLPLKKTRVEENVLHSERYEVSPDSQDEIRDAKKHGKSVVAVGTTTVRVLESWVASGRPVGETHIFIYPGYQFGMVDSLITNFHLPQSSLLMLVCAFGGQELILRAYREAVEQKYRFFSFGDAMLII